MELWIQHLKEVFVLSQTQILSCQLVASFSVSSVKTRTRIITVPGRFAEAETRVNPIVKNCTEECECSRGHEIHCMQAYFVFF